jgi:hypothetical protein
MVLRMALDCGSPGNSMGVVMGVCSRQTKMGSGHSLPGGLSCTLASGAD